MLGEVDIDVENAINQGVYCTVKLPESPSREIVKDIEKRMRELVEKDIPLKKEELTREEALARFDAMGCPEKKHLLDEIPSDKNVPFY